MSHCDHDSLLAYADGRLAQRQIARVSAHVSLCPDCARAVREQQSVKRLLGSNASRVAVPPGLSPRIAAALNAAPPPVPTPMYRRISWKGGLPLAVVVVTTAIGLWTVRTRPQPVDVAALVSVHRHAFQPPAGKTLETSELGAARQWLEGNVPEASTAPALRLPLVGVGACHVGDSPVAIWMYRASQPVTLLEVYSREQPPAWSSVSRRREMAEGTYGGYNVIVWTSRNRTFALVSTVPMNQMNGLLERSP